MIELFAILICMVLGVVAFGLLFLFFLEKNKPNPPAYGEYLVNGKKYWYKK